MTIPTQRLQEVLRARIGQEFDGECHLTEAEANEIIEALSQAEDQLAKWAKCVETADNLAEDLRRLYKAEEAQVVALTARLSQAEADLAGARGWQDIESAPKDGTAILMCGGNGVEVARWHGGLGGPGWLDDSGAAQHDYWNYVGSDNPTHWMPLPPPPSNLDRKGT